MNDEPLDKMLTSAYAEEPHIDDNGFTSRVMQQLPSPALTARRRMLVLTVSSVAACVCAIPALPSLAFVATSVSDVLVAAMNLQLPAVSSLALLGLLVWMTARLARAEA